MNSRLSKERIECQFIVEGDSKGRNEGGVKEGGIKKKQEGASARGGETSWREEGKETLETGRGRAVHVPSPFHLVVKGSQTSSCP